MRNFVISTLLLLSVFTVVSAQSVRNVFGFPATEPGYSLGVSACYAGQIGDYIVMAGGCNFPTPGNKTYYAGIYAAPLDDAVLHWQLVGFLPEPAAYGATMQAVTASCSSAATTTNTASTQSIAYISMPLATVPKYAEWLTCIARWTTWRLPSTAETCI